MNVFCALMTTIGRSGRALRIRGMRSNAFSSGITTSVITRSPSPCDIHRHSVAAFPVERTSYPARDKAWLSTVRIAASSSATKMLPVGMFLVSRVGRQNVLGDVAITAIDRHQDAENRSSRLRFTLDNAAVVADNFRDQRETTSAPVRFCGDEWIEQMRHQIFWHA